MPGRKGCWLAAAMRAATNSDAMLSCPRRRNMPCGNGTGYFSMIPPLLPAHTPALHHGTSSYLMKKLAARSTYSMTC
jgi:hypothetical protein